MKTNENSEETNQTGGTEELAQDELSPVSDELQASNVALIKRTVEALRDWQLLGAKTAPTDLEMARTLLGSVSEMREALSYAIEALGERCYLPEGMPEVRYE